MYLPSPFAVADVPVIQAMIARAGLATLVTDGPDGLTATPLPMLWDPDRGVLEGHVARPNPQADGGPCSGLAIFAGPHAYVSPSFYPWKAEHGRQVPTWNYEAVHMRGQVSWFTDAARLRGLLDRLTAAHESHRPVPWRLDDAPPAYIDGLLRGIVGVEMTVERVFAKRKLSQNKDGRDRQGVIAGLRADGVDDLADLMADLETVE